jgi:hypothetical protein
VTLVALGTCTIQATQAGNANYAAATPVTQSFQVVPTVPALTPLALAATTGLMLLLALFMLKAPRRRYRDS